MDLNNLHWKVRNVVNSLVGPRDTKEQLFNAWELLSTISPNGFHESVRAQIEAVGAELTTEGTITATLQAMSTERASQLAKQILNMAHTIDELYWRQRGIQEALAEIARGQQALRARLENMQPESET